MTTIETYRTRLSEDYVRDPNNKIWNTSAVDRAINKGYTKVQQDLNRSEGENENNATTSTVVGSELYSLPTNFIRAKLVRYNGEQLIQTTRKEVKKMDSTSQSGTPKRYYLYNNKIGLYPVPDDIGTIDLEYYETESELTTSQDSQLPDMCDDAILIWAAYKLWLPLDAKKAANLRQDYEDEMNRLKISLLFDDDNDRFTYERYGYYGGDDVLIETY